MAITVTSIVRFAKYVPLPFSKKSVRIGCSGGRAKGTGASDGYCVSGGRPKSTGTSDSYSVGHSGGQ